MSIPANENDSSIVRGWDTDSRSLCCQLLPQLLQRAALLAPLCCMGQEHTAIFHSQFLPGSLPLQSLSPSPQTSQAVRLPG